MLEIQGQSSNWAGRHAESQFHYSILCAVLPSSSAGKESACNAVDPGSIPGLESSPGEGIGYPLLYSWASPVAQTVKDRPAM